jgi:hypothetical protein
MLFGKDVMIGACADPLEVVGPDGEHAVSEIVLSISAKGQDQCLALGYHARIL